MAAASVADEPAVIEQIEGSAQLTELYAIALETVHRPYTLIPMLYGLVLCNGWGIGQNTTGR